MGNWTGYVQKTSGSTDLNQARTFNAANETTQIDSSTTHVAHDMAGNMTKLPKPASWSAHYDLVFDAWNRLVSVVDGGSTVAEYQYDARNYRVVKKTYSGGSLSETRHFYYDGSWQVVEERLEAGGVVSSNANRQYVWGLRYKDDLVLRDRDTTGNGTLDERLYALQDPNWNVAAIAGTNGAIQERYTYTAYGKPSFLDATFTVRSPNVTSYVWDSLYTSREYDPETGFYYYRNRFYSAELGRFPSRDPIGYAAGMSLYEYASGMPLVATDPSGEASGPPRDKCCCARSLTGPDGVNSVQTSAGSAGYASGVDYDIHVGLEWINAAGTPAGGVDCIFDWFENVASGALNNGTGYGKWYNAVTVSGNPFWPANTKRDYSGKEALTRQDNVRRTDRGDWKSIMYGAIRVANAPDCPCGSYQPLFLKFTVDIDTARCPIGIVTSGCPISGPDWPKLPTPTIPTPPPPPPPPSQKPKPI